MAITYEPIQTYTVSGTSTSTVTFSSIPATYTDIVVIFNPGYSINAIYPYMLFNNDTSTLYSITNLLGTGSAASSQRGTGANRAFVAYDPSSTSAVGDTNFIAQIMNYANTTTYKTYLARANNATASGSLGTAAMVGLYRSTSAISRIDIKGSNSGTDYNFANGSNFTLYGIKAA